MIINPYPKRSASENKNCPSFIQICDDLYILLIDNRIYLAVLTFAHSTDEQ